MTKVLIASAAGKFAKAKPASVALRLTAQGRMLLKVAKTLKIVQQGSFTPTHSEATTVSRTVTLTAASPMKKTIKLPPRLIPPGSRHVLPLR